MNHELDSIDTRTDADITREIELALLEDEDISTDNVHIDVQNGKVIVEGEVGNLEDKQMIGDMIEDIDGVALVENNLVIERI